MDLIVLAFTDKWADWERDGFPSRTAKLTRALEAHDGVGHVLVVDAPSSFVAAAASGSGLEPFTLEAVSPTVTVLGHRRLLPRERHRPAALRFNGLLHDGSLAVRIGQAARELGMRRPVALHAGPLTAPLFGRLGERATIYDAVDDWAVHPAFARGRAQIERAYGRILDEADVIMAVSTPLAERFAGARGHVEVLRNAVDESFLDALPTGLPDDVAGLPRPLIGYTGVLEQRVDAELVARVAAALPDYTFAFVGPVTDEAHFAPLRDLANVRFLGPRNHEALAGYIRAFDACIMPHRDTPLTRSMDPIKLHEYIACGRRVVMTAVGDWSHLNGFVRIATNPEEFENEVRRVVTAAPVDEEAARRYARENSWARRADRIVKLVEEWSHA